MHTRSSLADRDGNREARRGRAAVPGAILACAARHLYFAAGDLGVDAPSGSSMRDRFDSLKASLRGVLTREAGPEEILAASPRIRTAGGPSWTLIEAVAAALPARRVAQLGDGIDPTVVSLASSYLGGVEWLLPGEVGVVHRA